MILFSCGQQGNTTVQDKTLSQASTKGNTVCSEEYRPVCGQPPMPKCPEGMLCAQVMPNVKTFQNLCKMKNEGAYLMYEGECTGAPL